MTYSLKLQQHPLPGHGKLRPWGIMVHTTGDGVPADAHASGRSPYDVGVETYAGMREGPHYMIAPCGTVAQFRQCTEVTWHCGVRPDQRRDFLSGHWESLVPKGIVRWWHDRWPKAKSPQHLYPSVSPNDDYIGIELVPCGTYVRGTTGSWQPVFGPPAGGELGRFTAAQYVSLALLTLDIGGRYGIPLHGARLLGHEDVNPITRPGWDPGAFREFFSWPLLRGVQDGLKLHDSSAVSHPE